jgi:hypothetical protein
LPIRSFAGRLVGTAVALALAVPATASATTYVGASRGVAGGSFYAIAESIVPVTVSIERGGVAVASNTQNFSAEVDVAPRAGDVLRVTINGQQVFNRVFDGRPTFDATVCGTVTSFSGLRSSATTAVDWVGAYRPGTNYAPAGSATGSLTTLAGETFGGTLSRPVGPGWVLYTATRDVIGGVAFDSYVEQKVGVCAPAVQQPQPQPQPGPTPRDTTPPTGTIFSGKTPIRGGLRALLGGTAFSIVVVGEPGVTVRQAVYLDDGAKLPAEAAVKRRKPRRPTLLASGRAVSKAAGKVTVKLHATKKARTLRRRHELRVALVTTLRDPAGNVKRLRVKRLTLKR